MGAPVETEATALEFTPTWIVAGVCSLIVLISLLAERGLHYVGKKLKKKNQKPLYEALLKVKEELMLLGFISLLLTVFQGKIEKTCIPVGWTLNMLPCEKPHGLHHRKKPHVEIESHFEDEHCNSEGKVPLLSLEATHQLHIFIFVLATTHVIFSVTTMVFGSIQIHQWKQWENEIQNDAAGNGPKKVTFVYQDEFVNKPFEGTGTYSTKLSWLHSFIKQFYRSVSKSDYTIMRHSFITTHCPSNRKLDFHGYMTRALEADFRKVVGISWYLWIFVVIFLLLNVDGWHVYFWISFLPLILLLAVGTKLEHIIAELVCDAAKKHTANEGDVIVKPSDSHFWFGKPRIILYLIHFILFQNSFEIAFFFWILTTYGFSSCIMESIGFITTRLLMGVIIQLLCSYITLPLYAIVTQMGSHYKKQIFNEHVQHGVLGWAKKARTMSRAATRKESTNNAYSAGTSVSIEMAKAGEDVEVVGNIK